MPASKRLSLAREQTPDIVRWRRDFHRHPELSYREQRSARVIREHLEQLGLELVCPEGMHGFWADVPAAGASKTLAFRADMDALAMTEVAGANKASFVSQHEGVAHCCGHDAHMAILMATARLLVGDRAGRRHNVRLLFQHAEEMPPGGAQDLIAAGCLEGVDEVYGLHVYPAAESGRFVLQPGPFMAAADTIELRVIGKGGHAAMPHALRDPIVASAAVVQALQTLVSRRTSPMDALVVSICTIEGGSGTSNVIPDEVRLLGTVRTLSPTIWEQAPQWIEAAARGAAAAAGCEVELSYQRGYPVLVNDAEAAAYASTCAQAVLGDDGLVSVPEPWMASEDFARYLQQRPGCYGLLGVGSEAKGTTSPNHATDFDVDEDALHRGVAWFLELAAGGSHGDDR
jgi:amidohydrolase